MLTNDRASGQVLHVDRAWNRIQRGVCNVQALQIHKLATHACEKMANNEATAAHRPKAKNPVRLEVAADSLDSPRMQG